MKLGTFLLTAGSLLTLVACGEGGGSSNNDSGGNKSSVQRTTNLDLSKDELLFKVQGTCGKDRSYRVLETELIPQDNGNTAVGQLMLLEDGTYTISIETFSITEKGAQFYTYNRGKDQVTPGKWIIEDGLLKIGIGSLEKIADASTNSGDEFYEFTDAGDPQARKIIFRPIEKISERYIPSKLGCPKQDDLLARRTNGKFGVQTEDGIETSHLFRNTPGPQHPKELMSGHLGSLDPDNFFCKNFASMLEHCQAKIVATSSQGGLVTIGDGDAQPPKSKFNYNLRVDDNHFEMESHEGPGFNLVPQPGVQNFMLEETEDIFSNI